MCPWKPDLEEARRKGAVASLSVAKWNRSANALYERHGFTAIEDDEGTQVVRAGV